MKQARTVHCTVTSKLKVESASDPSYKAGKGIKIEVDATGEHYGWPLGKLIEKGYDERSDTVPDEMEVCANPSDDPKHFNTIAPEGYELVKLDAGYWGSYYRKQTGKDRTRTFGMIVGHDLYTCRFHSPDTVHNPKKAYNLSEFESNIELLPPDPEGFPSPARKFMQLLLDNGFACELISHTAVRSSRFTQGMSDKVLRIFIPDLHLPERWPDEPQTSGSDSALCTDPYARQLLQTFIIGSQHSTGALSGNSINRAAQERLQLFLESVLVDGAKDRRFSIDDPKTKSARNYSADEVLAELAFVERRVRCASTWFYQPVPEFVSIKSTRWPRLPDSADDVIASGFVAGAGALSKIASGSNVTETLGDLASSVVDGLKSAVKPFPYAEQTTTAPSNADPGAAIDLINFLRMIRDVRKEAAVEVYQVGDLLELWMNREFLYSDFPTIDRNLGFKTSKFPPADLASIAGAGLAGSATLMGDGFQQRRGPGWRNTTRPTSRGLRKYVYDEFPSLTEMLARHRTGWNFLRDEAKLAGKARFDNTEKMYAAIGESWIARRTAGVDDLVLGAAGLSPESSIFEKAEAAIELAKKALELGPEGAARAAAAALQEEIAKAEANKPLGTPREVGEAVVNRVVGELHQRVVNVENFSLPLTDAAKQSHGWETLVEKDPRLIANMFRDPNAIARPKDEFLWSVPFRVRRPEYYFNQAVLSLLKEVGCKFIHGNHDGYRSDPLLKGATSPYEAQEYLHLPGIWVEHSHRFEEFNRDGRIFGAGMTNLVHYFNDEMLQLDKAKGAFVTNTERKSYMPGATQWFVHVNLSDPAKRGSDFQPLRKDQQFCVYVGGHTHDVDLVRIHLLTKKPV